MVEPSVAPTTAWAVIRETDYEYGASLLGVLVGEAEAVERRLLRDAEDYVASLPPDQVRKRDIRAERDADLWPDRVEVYLDHGGVQGERWTAVRFKIEAADA